MTYPLTSPSPSDQPTTASVPSTTTPSAEPISPSPVVHQEPVHKKPSFNKKAVMYIVTLFVIGAVVGLILSNVFITETNNRIQEFNEQMQQQPFPFPFYQQNLTTEQVILPTFGVVIVCISVLLLIGVIGVYTKIVLKTKSRYIISLLIFLVPLLAETLVSLSALRSLFISAAVQYGPIRETIGFGFGGFGGVLVIVSVFEIIGLTMLLYVSTE